MMNVTVLCVGRLKEQFYKDAVAEYLKRLSPFVKVSVVELPDERLPRDPSQALIDAALAKEAAAIREKLSPGCVTAAMCIEGELMSSEQLAKRVGEWMERSQRVVFLVGSSNGLDAKLKSEAAVRLSMSPMTFPHHLARVMLLEQLYRAFSILGGRKYHK